MILQIAISSLRSQFVTLENQSQFVTGLMDGNMKNEKQNLLINLPVPSKMIERRIYFIREQKVMLDADLAELYEVLTKNLNLAVRRNKDRFPQDFMFQLNEDEFENLRLQIATSSLRFQFGTLKHGGRRYFPYAFTEQGVAMLSSVLNSKRAIAVNIAIMRAFVKLRQLLPKHKSLEKEMEKLKTGQKRLQLDVAVIFHVIKKLIQDQPQPQKLRDKIGFRT